MPSSPDQPAGPTPVVFLHGLLESPAIWDEAVRAVANAGHPVLAPPLPGHRGDAATGAEADRLLRDDSALARDLAAKASHALTAGRMRLVGHSLGGLLALRMARERPDLVEDVIVAGALNSGDCGRPVSLATRVVTEMRWGGAFSMRLMLRRWTASETRFENWIGVACAQGERLRGDVSGMRAELATADPTTLRKMSRWALEQDAINAIGEVETPVTCLVSACDPIVKAGHQMAVVRALPRGVAEIIDTGHLPMLTSPARFMEALMAWLQRPRSATRATRGRLAQGLSPASHTEPASLTSAARARPDG